MTIKSPFTVTGMFAVLVLHPVASGQTPADPDPASQQQLEAVHDSPAMDMNARPGRSESDFTIIVLPDTQYYCCGDACPGSPGDGDPATFTAQTQWIVDNREALNIVFVSHMGDIVQVATRESEWIRADESMSVLEDPNGDGIPFGVAPGNHDQWPLYDPDGDSTLLYNQYFGESRYSGREYYGGHYGDNNDNNFQLFSAGGMDFIIIHLELCNCPPLGDVEVDADVRLWADNLLKTYSDRRAIVAGHFFLVGSSRCAWDTAFSTQGRNVYDSLKENPNFFLMLCGHVNSGRRMETFNGITVPIFVSNFQNWPNGGDGYLRILRFLPDLDEIRVTTYSPTLDEYLTDCRNKFTLSYDMDGSCPDPFPGDFDCDLDVDLFDFNAFLNCATEPDGEAAPGCLIFDFDKDGDVDFIDFGEFQSVFTGPLE